jgi:peptide/nickel transport system substrate-binding protein
MRRRLTFWGGAMVAALVLVGCGSGGSGTGTPVRDGTFEYGVNYDPGSNFNPYTNLKTLQLAPLAYDTLLHTSKAGKLVSGLAEAWSSTADSATYKIRKGVTCADGTPLDASNVAKAINFVADPANRAAIVGLTLPLTTFHAGVDAAKGTVTVKLAEPFSFTLEAFGRMSIVCPKGLEDPGRLREESVGSGPYVLTAVAPGERLTFERREGYAWGPGGEKSSSEMPKTIEVRIGVNGTTGANLLQSGELNAGAVAGADASRLQAQGFFEQPVREQYGLMAFNQREGHILRDEAVREAIVTGVDLDQLEQVGTSGLGSRATSFIPAEPNVCNDESVPGNLPRFDPAKAKQMLTEAGWVPGADGIRSKDGESLQLSIHYETDALGATVTSVMELLQQQLRDLGIATTLTGDDLNSSLDVLFTTGNWDLFWGQQQFQYPSDLLLSYSGSPPPVGLNFTGVENPEVDALAPKAQSKPAAQSCPVWQEIEESMIRHFDLIPVSTSNVPVFGKDASFEVIGGVLMPTTIRMFG